MKNTSWFTGLSFSADGTVSWPRRGTSRPGCWPTHVVTVARDPRRADPLQQQIEAEVGADRFDVVPGDLSRRDDVLAAAHHIADRHHAVHILVNNAGAHFPDRRLSVDGVEMHVALDYLAGFGLTALLHDPLILGRARIVNVASDTLNDTRQVKLLGRPRPVTLDTAQLADLRALNPEADPGHVDAHRSRLIRCHRDHGSLWERLLERCGSSTATSRWVWA